MFNLWRNLVILYVVWGLASSEVLWGVGIISSQVFGHLRSFKGWIQTEACEGCSVAVVPSKQKIICSTKAKE